MDELPGGEVFRILEIKEEVFDVEIALGFCGVVAIGAVVFEKMSCVRGERFIGPGEGDEDEGERGEVKGHAV